MTLAILRHELHRGWNPLVIGLGKDASERTLGIAPVAAVTALVPA